MILTSSLFSSRIFSFCERYFFKSALEEVERLKRLEQYENGELEEELDQNDLVSVINH